MGSSRREFLQSAAALAGIAISPAGAEAKLPARVLGKTEMERLARALSTRNKTALVEFSRRHVDA